MKMLAENSTPRRIGTLVAALLFSLVTLSAAEAPQGNPQRVSGRVTGIPADLPVLAQDLRVELVSENAPRDSRDVAVYGAGEFDFDTVPPGRYLLKVKPSTLFEKLSSTESSTPIVVTTENVSVNIPLYRGVEVRGTASGIPMYVKGAVSIVAEPRRQSSAQRTIRANLFTNTPDRSTDFVFWAEPGEYTISVTGAALSSMTSGSTVLRNSILTVREAPAAPPTLNIAIGLPDKWYPHVFPNGRASSESDIGAVAAEVQGRKSARVTLIQAPGFSGPTCRLTLFLAPVASPPVPASALVECAEGGDAAFDGPLQLNRSSKTLSKSLPLTSEEEQRLRQILDGRALWNGQADGSDPRGGDGTLYMMEFQSGGKRAYIVASGNPTFQTGSIRQEFSQLLHGVMKRAASGRFRV
jgi:hypothetical protein